MSGNTVIFLVGPTGIGKTSLSIRLAKKLNAEVISSDSMQVYKGMRILSQAPTQSQRGRVKHHLIGALNPSKEYSASDFRIKASWLIRDIIKRGKTPIVVGGSGLYVKALVDGLFPSPGRDPGFRKRMQDYRTRYGPKRLYLKLRRKDPEAAEKIHPNDTRRVIRALEVYHTTGKKMSELKKKTQGLREEFKIEMFGLTGPRAELYEKIDSRIDWMFEEGLVDEIKKLSRLRLGKTARAAIGLKEVLQYLRGVLTLDSAKELLKKNTRHFAKRQFAWFKPDKRINWFDVSKLNDEEIVKEICEEVNAPHQGPISCVQRDMRRR